MRCSQRRGMQRTTQNKSFKLKQLNCAMHANKTSLAKQKEGRDISVDMYPFIRKYKDGSIERFLRSPFVLASPDQGGNRGVTTRDVVVDKATGVSVRLFLPSRAADTAGRNRLPLVIYVHGGSFCTESAFGRTYHRYATSLAASAGALVVSVEYRLAPEFPIPAAYDDAWAALQWAASSSDPWLASYADWGRTFLAGDSAGGNIVYHTAVRASHEVNDDMMDIEGLIMVHPYFWGAKRLPSELAWADESEGASATAVFPPYGVDRLWPFVTAGQAGNDDPRIDPPASEVSSLACRRVLIAVAGKDTLRDRGLDLAARIRDHDAPWPWMTPGRREVTVVESEGEDHGFHLYCPLRATSKRLMGSIVEFINQQPSSSPANPMVFGVPTTPFKDVFGYGTTMKSWGTRSSMARNRAHGPGAHGPVWPSNKISVRLPMPAGNAHHKQHPLSAAAPWGCVMNKFF
ncbi:probable carboxylesterase 5 [Aegilops tauschii subsp. strangulata]|uniref:probable carboxylesterase 5 n=1 Tax=Aegilops tauschii subsp. strangulata TaxID=200361 RepID=UPI003CC87034